jgi:ABC-type uncharacterized transport system permease subunit
MAQIVAEFFGIIGVNAIMPSNMLELIPYLLTVVVGVFIVSAVFRVIASIAAELFSMRRM